MAIPTLFTDQVSKEFEMSRHTRSLINACFRPFVIPNAPISTYERAPGRVSFASCCGSRPFLDSLFDYSIPGPTLYLIPVWHRVPQLSRASKIVRSLSCTCTIHGHPESPFKFPSILPACASRFGYKRNVLPPMIGPGLCSTFDHISGAETRENPEGRLSLCILPRQYEEHRTLNFDLLSSVTAPSDPRSDTLNLFV